MLKRTILHELELWKNRKHHPLVIKGLRQVGKTYIVKEFGKTNYESVVYIDFRSNSMIHSVFDGDFDINLMIMAITANDPKARFIPYKTLIILDEIQDCPNARSSLKYWDIDGRYDVIATGSFLGVKGFREPYTRGVPVGYEETLTMYPLTFKEFLINVGISDEILQYVEKSLKESAMINEVVHKTMRELYYQYLIVGGMPEVVNVFFETHDLNQVRLVQQRLVNSIKDDFGRSKNKKGEFVINETLKLRAEGCLDSLPSQLAKDYKKFQYSKVDTPGKSVDKEEGLQYLVDVGLVMKAYNVRELVYPLEGVKIANEFKAFYTDTGLLISQLGIDTASKILKGDLSAYKGAIAENMVAAAFNANNIGLYYYHAPSGSPELDFIVEHNEKIMIIECKSTNNKATSMKYVLANPKKYGLHEAVKIADANVGMSAGFKTIPLYALGFINNNKELKIPVVDYSKLKLTNQ